MILLRIRKAIITEITNYVKNDCNGKDGCVYKGKLFNLEINEIGNLSINNKPVREYSTDDLMGLAKEIS